MRLTDIDLAALDEVCARRRQTGRGRGQRYNLDGAEVEDDDGVIWNRDAGGFISTWSPDT
jgi:hypothetical protein